MGHGREDLIKGGLVLWVHVGEADAGRLLQMDELAQIALSANDGVRDAHLVTECGKPKYELWVSCQVNSEVHPLTTHNPQSEVCAVSGRLLAHKNILQGGRHHLQSGQASRACSRRGMLCV
eukprot:XP_001706322.1 Hypothetical protein GL50803_20429 [Giardia lamblia ATCC 50803]